MSVVYKDGFHQWVAGLCTIQRLRKESFNYLQEISENVNLNQTYTFLKHWHNIDHKTIDRWSE